MIKDFDERVAQEWFDRKSAIMESLLGKQHDRMMHAIIPYAIGGGPDLYYYPSGIPGTAIATKELCEMPGKGSSNDVFDTYELVMFTKCQLYLNDAKNKASKFGRIHATIDAALNVIAPYSANATLNPNETCELPEEMDDVGGKCFIFDAYSQLSEKHEEFGLLAVIEVFRTEMNFAREFGGGKLISKLKNAGHYPYSDIERKSVI